MEYQPGYKNPDYISLMSFMTSMFLAAILTSAALAIEVKEQSKFQELGLVFYVGMGFLPLIVWLHIDRPKLTKRDFKCAGFGCLVGIAVTCLILYFSWGSITI